VRSSKSAELCLPKNADKMTAILQLRHIFGVPWLALFMHYRPVGFSK